MFSRMLKHRAGMGAVLVTSILLLGSLVGPAFGAPSPLKVAKKALKTAKKANKTAKSANKRSKKALSRAKSADTAAKSANTAAGSAGSTAGSALSKAGQALSLAQSAATHSGPGGFGISDGLPVPTDGSSVEDHADCPTGFVAVGGGVDVYSDVDGSAVTEGVTITESAVDFSSGGAGWVGAVQDVDHASERIMEVTVQCAKPSSIAGASARRR
jgi:hypothetical protein